MRNDARPVGEESHQSPVSRDHTAAVETESTGRTRPTDDRDTVAHDRQSHIVNRDAEDQAKRRDADTDPVMPTGDSSLRTNI